MKKTDILSHVFFHGGLFRLVALILLVLFFSNLSFAGNDRDQLVNCNLHHRGCAQRIGEAEVTLEAAPRPVKAMTDLVFRVTLSGGETKVTGAPHIDLNMPEMNMGKNRVKMRLVAPNVYEGKGIIVRCASGHRIWKATVVIPELGEADFIFDVIY